MAAVYAAQNVETGGTPDLFFRVACVWTMKPFALQLGYALVSISAMLTELISVRRYS